MFYLVIIIGSFIFTELLAWFTHKFLMHKWLWFLHKDHHIKESKHRFIEHNDSFFLVFALPAATLICLGSIKSNYILLSCGIGLTLYGVCYFLVHDIFIHQRLKWFKHSNNKYLRAIRRAHKTHHKNITPENSSCFGLLFFPKKFLKEN